MDRIADYLKYHRRNALAWEIDTQTDFGVWYYRRLHVDIDTLCWYTYLNALCEFSPCAILFQKTLGGLNDFTREDIRKLTDGHFLSNAHPFECRWVYYNLEQVLFDTREFVNRNGGSMIGLVRDFSRGNSRQERYSNFEKRFKIKNVGRYINLLWTELLFHIFGIDFEPTLDVSDNYSVRAGLMYALGVHDKMSCSKRGSTPNKSEREYLTEGLEEIIRSVMSMNIHKRHKTLWAIETTLCTYNKFNHGRRWLGYYKKRQTDQRFLVEKLTREAGSPFLFGSYYDRYINLWGRWGNSYR